MRESTEAIIKEDKENLLKAVKDIDLAILGKNVAKNNIAKHLQAFIKRKYEEAHKTCPEIQDITEEGHLTVNVKEAKSSSGEVLISISNEGEYHLHIPQKYSDDIVYIAPTMELITRQLMKRF